jgi:hypothetical protein
LAVNPEQVTTSEAFLMMRFPFILFPQRSRIYS